jgi:multidrug transporter EmrE-like cation transporter
MPARLARALTLLAETARRAAVGNGSLRAMTAASPLAFLPLILFTVFTNAAAQIMLKKGMVGVGALDIGAHGLVGTVFRVVFNPFVFAGLATFVVSMASHLVVLSKVQLSYAYPFLSLAYVVVGLYSWFFFGEDMNMARILGFGLIIAGTIAIAQG